MKFGQSAPDFSAEDAGTVVELLDESDEPAMFGGTVVERDGEQVREGAEPISVTVCGMNSKQHARAEAWLTAQSRGRGGKNPTDKQQREEWAGFLARCCRAWNGFFDDDGQPMPFTVENMTNAILQWPFVRRQVQSALGNAARFHQKTATP